MKKIVFSAIALLIVFTTCNAQRYERQDFYTVSPDGMHHDTHALYIESLGSSNPNTNPNQAAKDYAASQTAAQMYTQIQYGVYTQTLQDQIAAQNQQLIAMQQQLLAAQKTVAPVTTSTTTKNTTSTNTSTSTVDARCYYIDRSKQTVVMDGTVTNGIFTPTTEYLWNGTVWVSKKLTAKPFEDLSFCGGYINAEWKSVADWNTTQYAFVNNSYDINAAPKI